MAIVGPLLVLLPRSYGAEHLVLEHGYELVKFMGRRETLDVDENVHIWF